MEDVPTQTPIDPTSAPQESENQEITDIHQEKEKNKKRIYVLLVIFVFLFLVSAAGLGTLIYKKGQDNTLFAPKTAPTSIPTPTVNPRTNMLTYTNPTYEFTAQYPTDWTVLPTSQENNVTFSGPSVGNGEASKPALVSIQVFETAKLKPGWENNFQPAPFSSTTINNGNYTYYVTAHTYTIGGQASEETKKLAIDTMNQILSTLKFTNQTSISPTNVVNDFYSDYVDCEQKHIKAVSENTTAVKCDSYRTSPFLSSEIQSKIAQAKFTDQILCAQNIPMSIKTDEAKVSGNTASITVHTYYVSSGDNPITVELTNKNNNWLISDIICKQ